ncbi:MAG: RHS repeat-associated core domain-containing protein [Pseudoxanthomonas sp.]
MKRLPMLLRRLLPCLLAGLPLSAAAQTYTQTEVITYHDNTAKWVLGQVSKRVVGGITVEETTFDATTAQPLTVKSFGRLQQTLTWNTDGTLATVKDSNNRITTVSNWKRGIPQSITYADSTTQSAFVNDNGWIESVTDQTGSKTCYAYDAMGRISQITYPSEAAANTCNTTTWNATTQAFVPVASTEYGIPANHWRQTVATGNARKITYFDALWRPLLTREYDTANESATQRFQRFAYDHEGRVTFASYPSTGSSPTTGTWTNYDPLGRVTAVAQDTELSPSVQVTTTTYQTGFKTLVIDPKGNATTTSYQAFDQPSYDAPVSITHPDNAVTEIARDVFGKPTAITRRNSTNTQSLTRSYAYDDHQQVCRSMEPETGATLYGYDAAGNLKWSAAGLPIGQNCEPAGTSSTVAARRVDRGYDARNRLSTLTFPDGRGNQNWTYTLDGLPSQITTYNDPGNTNPVVNAYTYNRRRLPTGESSAQPGWYSWGLGYGYTANGHLGSQSYPTGLVVTYNPNALGQPTGVADTGGQTYASNIAYYPNGAIQQFTYGNGIVHAMVQNARQLPQRTSDLGGPNTPQDYRYSYDANGNVTAIDDAALGANYNRTMTYDNRDRLTAAGSCSFGGDCWHHFSYDALDNLTSWTLAGVKDYAQYVYDGQNRLGNIKNSANATIVGLGYDVQGNLANKNGQLYHFDYGNRLREVTGKEYYRYDGHGRRVLAWEASSASNVLSMYSQSGQLAYEHNERPTGRKAVEHLYLAGSVIADRERNLDTNAVSVRYLHTDALGSPVAVTNSAGAVIERTQWEPYGAAIGKPAYQGIGYTGHVMDGATGLTYMQQRYYDPQLGIFDSVDPVTAYQQPITNFCRYCYARNNPYRFTDPDGRDGANFYTDEYRMAPPDPATARFTLELIADFTPIIGDIKGIVEAIQDPTVGNITAASVGFIPVVGDISGKFIKNADNIADAAKAGRRAPTASQREAALQRSKGSDGKERCTYCGAQLDRKAGKANSVEIDHKQAYSRGGKTENSNLDAACRTCNRSKGAKELGTEWIPPKEREKSK